MNISRFSFHNVHVVLLTALFLSLLGAITYRQMPASILPDFPFPRLVMVVAAGDMAIQDVVVRITRPLESASSSVPGAKRVTSKTSRGAAEISIDFDWGTSMFEAYTRLNAAVSQIRASLPPETSIQIEWVNPSSFPILGYSMTSSSHSPRELQELATLTVAPYLSRLNGVYRALVQGGQVREYRVLVDPHALAAAGLSIDQVSAAVANTNLLQSVGRFSRHYQSYLVLATAQLREVHEVLDAVVATKGGAESKGNVVIRIRDIARVQEGDEERQQIVTADGREAVLLSVLKQQGASTGEVSDQVRKALHELQRSNALPKDIVFTPFYDEADLLRDSLGSLRDALLLGAALGMVVLWLFLRNLRSTAIVFICLPMTVLIAFLFLRLLQQTLNIMTLGALAVGLGLIIDDVVVTLENVFRRVEAGATPLEAAVSGTYEIQRPLIGSTITRIAIFVPLAFLSGITGAFFAPLSITLALLLIVSVALALTVVPLICVPLISAGPTEASDSGGWFSWLRDRVYEPLLIRALRVPFVILSVTALIVTLSVFIFRGLPTGFLPEMDEGGFTFDYLAPAGTPLEDLDRLCRVIEEEFHKTPEIASYARRTGLQMGFFATDPNRGDMSLKLVPRAKRKRSAREVMDDVRDRCKARLPVLDIDVVAPLADRVADIAGEPAAIEVKFYGDDPNVLTQLAEKAKAEIENVKGTTESVHKVMRGGPELTVRIDPYRAALMGLTPLDVMKSLETSMFGRAETFVRSGERLIAIRVLYPKSMRRTIEQVRALPIMSKSGKAAPLESIAEVREDAGALEITRENQKPMIPVTAQLKQRDLGSANVEVQARIAKAIKLPPGYTVQYGGLYQTQQESFRSLATVLVLGMMLVFIVMVGQYHGFVEPTVLLISGLASLSGVAVALRVTGVTFNSSSFTGAIMIIGMVLTNGIMLMDAISAGREENLTLEEAILRGGRLRLRPVLMTSIIAVLTLLPLAFGIGAGAEMQRPLAVASIGGLACSPLFTLLLLPVLYYLFSGFPSAALRAGRVPFGGAQGRQGSGTDTNQTLE